LHRARIPAGRGIFRVAPADSVEKQRKSAFLPGIRLASSETTPTREEPMLTRLVIPLTLQILVPLALVWWHGRVRQRTFAAWTAMTIGVAGYLAATAAVGDWELAPWYTPFLFLLLLSAGIWQRAAWIRSLPRRPHSNHEWREFANYANATITGTAFALVAIATRPVSTESGVIDVDTLNLYRELTASLIGLAILVMSIRSARTGRVLLSALFVWASGTNLRVALTAPVDYLNYAQFAVLDLYRAFITGFFAEHITAIVGAIAVGQAAIAFLLATNGWTRRLGYIGAIIFLLAIVPLGVGAGFPATILMALAAAEVLHSDHYAVFGRNVNATAEELVRELPGDEFIQAPLAVATHAVTIFKSPRDVWPWLVQMGAGRGGWYSYDLVDNAGRPSAKSVVRELQSVKMGAVFPALPGVKGTFRLKGFDPGRSLVLVAPGPTGPRVSWAFLLEQHGYGVTRLIVRARIADKPPGLPAAIGVRLMRVVHFIMERKQLNTLVARAEGI